MNSAIELIKVCKRYGSLNALHNIDLDIQAGEFFALLGPNGAGKTTLINIIAGLTLADSGSTKVMGHEVIQQYDDARRNLGVVPQELVFDPFFTVREALTIQSGYYGIRNNDSWINEIIHNLGLTDKADTNMRALSGGMKRRVLVAQALVHKPPVIILDEPTAGVDVALRQTLWDFINQLNRNGHTIVLTTHYLEEAEILCNRVAMLKQGKLVALDTMQNLISGISGYTLRLKLFPDTLPAELNKKLINYNGEYYLFDVDSYGQIEFILASLRRINIKVLDMNILQPDLEKVFVNMMHNGATQ